MQGKAIEHLVEQHIAFVHVDAKGVELRLLIAGSEAQDEPAARQPVERGGRLGEHERIAVGRQRQVGEQLQTFGGRRDVAQGHERIEALVSTGSQPAGTRDGVFGQRDAVEAGFFGCTCHLVEWTRVEHVALGTVGLGVLENELEGHEVNTVDDAPHSCAIGC